jgi:hypothetical protein
LSSICTISAAAIHVKKVLEGNIDLQCLQLQAQMINGDYVLIQAKKSVSAAAMYAARCRILTQENDLKINLFRGELAATIMGSISLKAVDGGMQVTSQAGDIHVQCNRLTVNSQLNSLIGQVHCQLDAEVNTISITFF